MGAEPGSVFFDGSAGRCQAAFVFTPDRPFDGLNLLLNLGALALFDAVAVLAPPQVPVHILAPDGLAVDGGRVATLREAEALARKDAIPDWTIPDWAVLGIDVAVGLQEGVPGETPDRTSLMEEGFGDVTPADVLTNMSRHLLGWIDAWQQHGGAMLQREVALRTLRATVAA